MRRYWHRLVMWVFASHFRDELTNTIHPDFGTCWREGGEGDKVLKSLTERQTRYLFSANTRCNLLRDALYGLVSALDYASCQHYSASTETARDEARRILIMTE